MLWQTSSNGILPRKPVTCYSINSFRLTDSYMRQQTRSSLYQMMVRRLTGAKQLSEPFFYILFIGSFKKEFSGIITEFHTFLMMKSNWKCRLQNAGHLSRPLCIKGKQNVFAFSVLLQWIGADSLKLTEDNISFIQHPQYNDCWRCKYLQHQHPWFKNVPTSAPFAWIL